MKQAFFILAAFLFLAPSMLMGQDFEVISPVGNQLKVNDFGNGGKKIDTSITIRNKTSNPLSISIPLEWNNSWSSSGQKTFTLAPLETKVIPVTSNPRDFGVYRDRIIITDGLTTVPISLEATLIPNLIDSFLAANTRLIRVYNQEIPLGITDCFPLVAMNNSSKAINIYSFDLEKEIGLSIDTLLSLPYVILPGEKITFAQICYDSKVPNRDIHTRNTFSASLMYDDEEYLYFDYNISTETDTTLLKPCLEITKTSEAIGPVLIGGSIEETITVKSNRYIAQFIDSVSFSPDPDHAFRVKGNPFPLVIDSLNTASFQVEFSPNTTQPVVKYRYATAMNVFADKCKPEPVDISALAILPTADSIATPLFPDKEYVLGMSSSAPSFSQDFHFVNNGITNTKIISVGLADPSPEFVVTNITPTNTLPFTLLPGEKMTVSVLFTPSQVGKVFFNQLVITTEQGIQSISYPLQGLRTTTSGVHEYSEPSIAMTLTPNPAKSVVTVAIKGAGLLESAVMVDELGKEIYTIAHSGQPEWKWDLPADRIPSGNYFIRVTGKSPDGKPFVATKRLVVQ